MADHIPWRETGTIIDAVPSIGKVIVKYDPYTFTDYSYDFNDEENWVSDGAWHAAYDGEYFYNSTIEFEGWVLDSAFSIQGLKEHADDSPEYMIVLGNWGGISEYTIPRSNITEDAGLSLKISLDAFVQMKEQDLNIYGTGDDETNPFLVENHLQEIKLPFYIKVGTQSWKGGQKWSDVWDGSQIQPLYIRQQDLLYSELEKSVINDKWTTGHYILIPLTSEYATILEGEITFGFYDVFKNFFEVPCQPATFNIPGQTGIPTIGFVNFILLKNIKIEIINNATGKVVVNEGIQTTGEETANLLKKDATTLESICEIGPYGTSKGSYKAADGSNLAELYRAGSTRNLTFARVMIQSFHSQYKKPRFKLDGTLDVISYGLNVLHKIILDSSRLGSKGFFIAGGTYYDREEKMQVTMVEVTNVRDDIPRRIQ